MSSLLHAAARPPSPFAGGVLGQILTIGGLHGLPTARPGLRDIALNRIVAGSELQTRALFNPKEDSRDAELVESVRQVGVRQSVHLQEQADGSYRIRSGHRRVNAARLAALERIPAIVWPPESDVFDSALDTWLKNLHRKDLAALERARMLALVLDRFGLPRSEKIAQSRRWPQIRRGDASSPAVPGFLRR